MEPRSDIEESEAAYEEVSLFEALISLFNNPLIGVFCSFLIPVIIVGYSLWAMKITPNVAGLVDHIVFILLFFLIFNMLLGFYTSLRILFSFGFVLAVATFFLSNTLYFRFFNTWGQLDAAKMWRDVPALWTGIVALANFRDYIFCLIIPIFLWQFSLRSYLQISKKTAFMSIGLLISLFCTHLSLAGNQLNYMENNPLFYMLREKKLQMSLRLPDGKTEIKRELSKYQMVNETLYERSQSDDYPFIKNPKPDIKPLPFAINTKPNVVLILMESVRAYEVGAYGGNPSLMPNLDEIAKEGILFKNYYSIATQTIRAEFSILSSYNPDVLGGPVYVNNPTLSVLTLPDVMKKRGYETIWMEAKCGSFTTRKINFLKTRGINTFYTDVPLKNPPLGLGAADEDTYDHAADIFSKTKEPFFAEIMTLSNHWTFDADYPTKSQTPKTDGDEEYRNYTHGIYYSDYALGKFIKKIRASEWGQNTVFLITGDHGIWRFPNKPGYDNIIRRKEIYYRSPFIIWSPNPKLISPRVINEIGSHIDLTPTILDLLNIHEPNPFLGTSLFRNDTGTRLVLLVQDGRWNIRIGNEYVYDVGPEIFASIPPFNMSSYLKEIRGKEMKYAYFSTGQDLMHDWDPEKIQTLSKERTQELKQFGQNLVDAYHAVILKNRIYKPEP